MRKYLLYSTIIGLFSDAFGIAHPINFKLFYIVAFFNLLALLFYWDFRLPKYYLGAVSYLWLSGLFEVALGPDRLPLFAKEVMGITLMSLYFYIFFKVSKRSVVELFDLYARTAFWICLLGIFLSLGESILFRYFVHVKSILPEPADFAIVVMPSFYYYASIRKTRRQKIYMYTILAALLLSVSSTGVLGLLLSAALLLRKKSWGLFFAPILVGILFFAVYTGSEHFRARVNDTFQSASTADVSKANLSTYALVSNAYVSIRAIQERPLFGYGVGGHIVAHRKYIQDLPGVEAAGELENLNAPDANSMLLRTMSEFGITGLVLIAFFIVHCWTPGDSIYATIGAAVFVYFCMALLRAGQWFNCEIYFFAWAYVFANRQYRQRCDNPLQSPAKASSQLTVAPPYSTAG